MVRGRGHIPTWLVWLLKASPPSCQASSLRVMEGYTSNLFPWSEAVLGVTKALQVPGGGGFQIHTQVYVQSGKNK